MSEGEGRLVRRRVLVAGRVQAVWFRQSCAERAASIGVEGWVRNRPDGRVEAVFEGDDASVEQMVAWAQDGPPRADVNEVEVRDEVPEGPRGFQVLG